MATFIGTQAVKKFKKGEYIRLVKKDGTLQSKVYVRGDYCREDKKYSIYEFNDICKERFVKGSTLASNDFEF